jgi:hypothetical protein
MNDTSLECEGCLKKVNKKFPFPIESSHLCKGSTVRHASTFVNIIFFLWVTLTSKWNPDIFPYSDLNGSTFLYYILRTSDVFPFSVKWNLNYSHGWCADVYSCNERYLWMNDGKWKKNFFVPTEITFPRAYKKVMFFLFICLRFHILFFGTGC